MPLIKGSLMKAIMLRTMRRNMKKAQLGLRMTNRYPNTRDLLPTSNGWQPILEYPCGNPTAYLTTPEEKTLTPILDTGASHCLLPVAHLTAEEVEMASRVHLRVANGTLTRALMYQNIIYAKRVPRPLVSVGQVTQSLGLTFHWSNGIPRLILHEEGESYE
eukprot:1351405-Amphidinium_carterae.1